MKFNMGNTYMLILEILTIMKLLPKLAKVSIRKYILVLMLLLIRMLLLRF